MKKNILIGILSICFMTSLGYGVIQQSEAENQRKRADEMEAKAIAMELKAMEAQRHAEMERMRAEDALKVAVQNADEAARARKK